MTASSERFDLIVVGLGAMGAAVAHHATALGLRVLGIDRHDPPHHLGSTTAETRITRLAVGEGRQYLPFVARSHEIWRDLEDRTGTSLLHQCGGYIITEQTPVAGQRWHDFVTETDRIAKTGGIDFEVFEQTADTGNRPGLDRLRGLAGKRIGFERSAGLVMAERAVAIQLQLAEAAGAVLRRTEPVTAVTPNDREVSVTTDAGTYRADQVVVAAGPWLGDLTDEPDRSRLTVTRQVVYWFEVDDPAAFGTDRFPFVMWVGDTDADYLGVFPIPPGGTPALKVLGEQFAATTHPEDVERTVSDAEIRDFYDRHVGPKLAGAGRTCRTASVCLYTNTPDDHFLIDTAPTSDRVLLMSPCSGHGFKHSAALGEAVAQRLATGDSTLDLTPFERARFGT
ncbi:MAG: N-methyl-L-tryptophan oxidase [Actinomycetota bacterium]